MRGYYAKINVIKNKIRAQGVKNAMVLADPDEVEKIWDKDKKKDDTVDEDVIKMSRPKTGATVRKTRKKPPRNKWK